MSDSQQIRAGDAIDDIDRLRDHCRGVIEAHPQSQARAFALTKLAEMIFWLRASATRQRREAGDGAA